jgi:hypothetical protein
MAIEKRLHVYISSVGVASLKELPLICDETTAIDFFRFFDARPAPYAFPRVDSAMTSYDHRHEILVGIFVAVVGDTRQHASRVAFSARDICAVVAPQSEKTLGLHHP